MSRNDPNPYAAPRAPCQFCGRQVAITASRSAARSTSNKPGSNRVSSGSAAGGESGGSLCAGAYQRPGPATDALERSLERARAGLEALDAELEADVRSIYLGEIRELERRIRSNRRALERQDPRAAAELEAATFDLAEWIAEAERQVAAPRANRAPNQARLARLAALLTLERIRSAQDPAAVAKLEAILRRLRRNPSTLGFAELARAARWGRPELGALIVEATNRGRHLAGQVGREKGPRLDPARIPDDRLLALIQTHRDLAVVEALRAERARRGGGFTP